MESISIETHPPLSVAENTVNSDQRPSPFGGYGRILRFAEGANHNKWSLVTFATDQPILKGPFHLSAFIDYLIEKGLLKTTNYINSIEMGNETKGGTGIVEFKDYSITVE